MVKKEKLFNIGIGTWKIDYENFNNDIDALVHSYNKGQNYLSLYMLYNNGEVVRQMKTFVDKVDKRLVDIGKVSYIGISNVNLARMGIISEDYRAQISPMIKERQALIELKTVPDSRLRTILMSINQNDIYYTGKNIEYINTKLDPFQREAVKKGITNNHITLIQGPPGTGKTSVITEIVQQIIKENKKSGVSNYKRILLVSKNNKAVDNVLNKLNEIIDKNVIMIRIGREEKITDDIYETYGID